MNNKTNIKIAKKYQDKINNIYVEGWGSDRQYVCELKEGYIFGIMECGIYFAQSQKELLGVIRREIEEEPKIAPKTIGNLTMNDIHEGDIIQQKTIKKPLKVLKVNGELCVSTIEALGVESGQPYIYIRDLKLEYLEKIVK